MRRMPFLFLFVVLVSTFTCEDVRACGHDGFYLAAGYEQLVMFSREDRLVRSGVNLNPQRVVFGPGFGAHVMFGYDYEGTRWGWQVPFEYSYIKLNKQEYLHYFSTALEPVLHLAVWPNGVVFSVIPTLGISVLPDGEIDDGTQGFGVNFGLGPKLSYFFARGDVRGSVYLQVPLRAVYVFEDNLSRDGTTLFAVPIRLGLSVGF